MAIFSCQIRYHIITKTEFSPEVANCMEMSSRDHYVGIIMLQHVYINASLKCIRSSEWYLHITARPSSFDVGI